jgi:hypothetical protein
MTRWLAVNQVSRPTSMPIDLSLLPAASATIRLGGSCTLLSMQDPRGASRDRYETAVRLRRLVTGDEREGTCGTKTSGTEEAHAW